MRAYDYLAKRNQAITRSTVETTPMITAKINFSSRNTSSRISRKSRSNCKSCIRLLPKAEGKECSPAFVTRNQGNWLAQAQLSIARLRNQNGTSGLTDKELLQLRVLRLALS